MPSVLALVLLSSSTYAETPAPTERDPATPVGLFECRSKEGKAHKLKLSDLDFVLPRCPGAPAILVTDDGGIEFGMPFAEVAKRLGDPGRPAMVSFRENLGTAEHPATFEFVFDHNKRLVSVRRGIADHVAPQIGAYWGPSVRIVGRNIKGAWFNPKARTLGTIEDRGPRESALPGGGDFDGHRYILELRAYTPVRELFGSKGPIQRGLIGKTVDEVERGFPELRVFWGQKLDTATSTLIPDPKLRFQQTELDSDELSAHLELVAGRIAKMTWDFGDGSEQTLTEILAEVFRAVGGAVIGSDMPTPNKLVVTFKLPNGDILSLSSSTRRHSHDSGTATPGEAVLWTATLSRP